MDRRAPTPFCVLLGKSTDQSRSAKFLYDNYMVRTVCISSNINIIFGPVLQEPLFKCLFTCVRVKIVLSKKNQGHFINLQNTLTTILNISSVSTKQLVVNTAKCNRNICACN
jgi:hypothetical protein